MPWKEATNTTPGDATKYGAPDIKKYSQLYNGVADVDTVDINSSFTIRSSKFFIRNPANTFSYTFVASAIAAARNITLPLLTTDDTLVVLALAQTLTNKTIAAGSNTITGIVDANIDAHTTTKITTISKSLLNSAIAYNDQVNVFGDFDQTFRSGKLRLSNPTNDFFYLLTGAAIVADRTVTMPLLTGNDTLVTEAFTQPLTNKTLDSTNTISSATSLPTVTIAKGGTGQVTATAAFDALAPTTTAGDVIYNNGTDNIRLAIGTAGQPLKVNAGTTAPEYGTLPVAGGGSGAVTLTGILKGNGTSAFTAVTAPSGAIVGDTDTQTLSAKTLTTPIVNGMKGGDVAITNVDSPYTALATTRVIRADATSGAITINLPTAVGIAGFEYHIFRIDIASSTNIITIDGSGTETIDSNLTYRLYTGEWVKLESDGANWQVLSRPTPTDNGYYLLKGATANRRYIGGFENNTAVAIITSTTSPAANTLWALPLIVSRTTKFDTISFNITSVSTAGNSRAGIYADNGNNYPGALIFDTGAIDTTTATLKDTTITASLQVFQPGLYWLAYEQDTATGQMRVLVTVGTSMNVMGNSALANTTPGWMYAISHTFGALPNPFTAGQALSATVPAVGTPVPAIGLRPV